MKKLLAALFLISSQAQAGIIYDTMRGPYTWTYPVFGFGLNWSELAVPFVVDRPGRITRVETLLSLAANSFHPMHFGIADWTMRYETDFQFQSAIWSTDLCVISPSPEFRCEHGDYYLQPDQMFNVNLSLDVQPGQYFLFASPRDPTFGDWHLSSIESNNWLYRDHDSNGWQRIPVADADGPFTLPAARIHFSAVPEPGTFALAGLALMFLAVARARKHRALSGSSVGTLAIPGVFPGV